MKRSIDELSERLAALPHMEALILMRRWTRDLDRMELGYREHGHWQTVIAR